MEFIKLPLGTMACQGAISAKFAAPGRIQTRPGQSVHDIFSLLVDRHEPIDEVILRAMLEGLCISEIVRALHVRRGFVETPPLGPLAIGTALVGKAPAPEPRRSAAHSENWDQTPKHHHPWPVD